MPDTHEFVPTDTRVRWDEHMRGTMEVGPAGGLTHPGDVVRYALRRKRGYRATASATHEISMKLATANIAPSSPKTGSQIAPHSSAPSADPARSQA